MVRSTATLLVRQDQEGPEGIEAERVDEDYMEMLRSKYPEHFEK
jgi:hypothetical protein